MSEKEPHSSGWDGQPEPTGHEGVSKKRHFSGRLMRAAGVVGLTTAAALTASAYGNSASTPPVLDAVNLACFPGSTETSQTLAIDVIKADGGHIPVAVQGFDGLSHTVTLTDEGIIPKSDKGSPHPDLLQLSIHGDTQLFPLEGPPANPDTAVTDDMKAQFTVTTQGSNLLVFACTAQSLSTANASPSAAG